MKKNLSILAGGLLILFLSAFQAFAQESKGMGPKMKHVLADSNYLLALEITLAPGEKTDLHTHPSHFFYALTEGKLTVHYQDGKEEVIELKPGISGASEPERPHVTENTGNTTVRFLIVELKEHPYKTAKKKK